MGIEVDVGPLEGLASAAVAVGMDAILVEVMLRERKYKAAQTNFKQYHTWKRERNPARAALEARDSSGLPEDPPN